LASWYTNELRDYAAQNDTNFALKSLIDGTVIRVHKLIAKAKSETIHQLEEKHPGVSYQPQLNTIYLGKWSY
jgi:hypothetical protein